MENASKALIIAGAILISIVLISVGILIVNGANSTINSGISKMSEQDKQLFNSTFLAYEGRQSGTQVKSLLTAIQSNNLENYEVDGKVITIEFENITSSSLTATSPIELEDQTSEAVEDMSKLISNLRTNINTGAKYDITLTNSASGLINKATIVKVVN